MSTPLRKDSGQSVIKPSPASCPTCPAGQQIDRTLDTLNRIETLGQRGRVLSSASLQRSIFEGEPVNLVSTSTGQLAFTTSDLQLSGTMPLTFQRVYSSDNKMDSGLGIGWTFLFNEQIRLNGDLATLTTGAGLKSSFRRDTKKEHFVQMIADPVGHQSFDLTDADTIIEEASGLTRTYKKHGEVYRLSQITDSNDNKILIGFDTRENVIRIANDSGSELILEWSNDAEPHLLSVTDNAGRRIGFTVERNLLRTVTDPAGAEWKYNYRKGNLTQITDPLNRTSLSVGYDGENRVSEIGNTAGTSFYKYSSNSDEISQRTVITDALGAQTTYQHSASGVLISTSDDEGHTANIEYNAANRRIRMTNSFGDETTFTYDSQNRLTRQASNDGAERTFSYDEHGWIAAMTNGGSQVSYTRDERGNSIAAKNSNPALSYQATINTQGQSTSIKSETGRELSYEYDSAGRKAAFTDAQVGTFKSEYDTAGRMVTRILPRDKVYHYEYDARGALRKQSDNLGHSLTVEKDASGALVGTVNADGSWMRAKRDKVGRVTDVTKSDGKSRHFTYNTWGSIKSYTNEAGKQRTYEYDRRGRLRTVTNDDGSKTIIERNERGFPRLISRTNGDRLRYEYDRAGKLKSLKREPGAVKFTKTGFDPVKPAGPNGVEASTQQELGNGCDPFENLDLVGRPGQEIGLECSLNTGFFGDFFFGNSWGDGGGGGGGSFFFIYDGYYDPFFWGFNPFFSFGGETCQDCLNRQSDICEFSRQACVIRSIALGVAAGVACTAISLGTGLLVCVLLSESVAALESIACNIDNNACVLSARDKCPQC